MVEHVWGGFNSYYANQNFIKHGTSWVSVEAVVLLHLLWGYTIIYVGYHLHKAVLGWTWVGWNWWIIM